MFNSHINNDPSRCRASPKHLARFASRRHNIPLFHVVPYRRDVILGASRKDDVIGGADSARRVARHIFSVVFFHLELMPLHLTQPTLRGRVLLQIVSRRSENNFYRLRMHSQSYKNDVSIFHCRLSMVKNSIEFISPCPLVWKRRFMLLSWGIGVIYALLLCE